MSVALNRLHIELCILERKLFATELSLSVVSFCVYIRPTLFPILLFNLILNHKYILQVSLQSLGIFSFIKRQQLTTIGCTQLNKIKQNSPDIAI